MPPNEPRIWNMAVNAAPMPARIADQSVRRWRLARLNVLGGIFKLSERFDSAPEDTINKLRK